MLNIFWTAILLTKYAIECLVFVWPALLVLGLIALSELPFMPKRWERRHLVLLLPLVSCAAVIAWGSAVWGHEQLYKYEWPNQVLLLLALLYFPLSGITIKFSKGYRCPALSIILLQGVLLFSCLFASGMAVSNTWL